MREIYISNDDVKRMAALGPECTRPCYSNMINCRFHYVIGLNGGYWIGNEEKPDRSMSTWYLELGDRSRRK